MFRIGEFSKIAQVSGRLLRFYDEIGLLSPIHTDPQTGYRFYSAQQLPRLNQILVLKELGLSLEQIGQLLERNLAPEELGAMLALRKAQIAQTIQDELARLRMVESRLAQITAAGQIAEPDVVLKAIPAQPFLALREILPDMEAVKRLVRQIATTVPAVIGPHGLGQIAVMIHSPIYEPDGRDVEVGYLLTGKAPQSVRLSEERVLSLRALPALEPAATLAHAGPVEASHQSYGALGAWLEAHGWQITGPGRELLIQLPEPAGSGDAVMEIQLPVRREAVKWGLDIDAA